MSSVMLCVDVVFRPLRNGQVLLGEDGNLLTQSLGHKILSCTTSVAAKAILITNREDAENLRNKFQNHEVYRLADAHYFRVGLVPHKHSPLLTTSHESTVPARTTSLC